MVTMLMPVFLLLACLMLEFGFIAVKKSDGRTAVDAAAKAATRQIANSSIDKQTLATSVLTENGVSADDIESLTITVGRWNYGTEAFELVAPGESLSKPANAVRVEAELRVPSVLMSLFGIAGTTQTVEAVATQPGIVLAVKNASTFRANDTEMIDFLTQFGVPVRVISEGQLGPQCIKNGEMLFISSSVSSSAVPSSTFDVPGPVVLAELNCVDDWGIVAPGKWGTRAPDDVPSWGTFGNVTSHSIDVEIDLWDMDDEVGTWRQSWTDWWDEEGSKLTVANRKAADPDDLPEILEKTTSYGSDLALYGSVKRDELADEAIVISTVPGHPEYVTCFWYPPGTKLYDKSYTTHKFAMVYTRTTEWSGSAWQYNADGYMPLAQTIRWMLMDSRPTTVLVD